jgi:TonB family protein
MSLPSAPSVEPVRRPAGRRKHARSKSDQWVYIDMGAKNGGFLRDVSEGGVCFQWFPGIMPLRDGQTLQLRFKLPGTNALIEAEGQFVRHGTSEKGGGLRLLNMSAEVQRQIREWVARQEHMEAPISGDLGVLPEPSGPITGPEDSVSSLAAEPGELSAEVPLVGRTSSLWISDASERAASLISELPRHAITYAVNQLKKAWAVLQSIAVRQESAAKAQPKFPFRVGLAVGCSLALFTIGVLVATRRLGLNTSSGSNPRSTVQAPAANSTEAPVKPQPEVSGISLPSTPTPSPQTAATGQRSIPETVRPSPPYPADPSETIRRAVNRPVVETNATPRQPADQVSNISTGSVAPQPQAVTQSAAPIVPATTAPVTQSAAPVAPATPPPTQSAAASATAIQSPNPEAARPPNLTPPKLLQHIDPVYPQDAKVGNTQGTVEILATIDKDGVPRGLRATRGDPRLAAAALAAISRWRYKPAMLDGQPVESQLIITVNFQL